MLNVQCPTAVPSTGPSLPSPPLTMHGIQGVSVRAPRAAPRGRHSLRPVVAMFDDSCQVDQPEIGVLLITKLVDGWFTKFFLGLLVEVNALEGRR